MQEILVSQKTKAFQNKTSQPFVGHRKLSQTIHRLAVYYPRDHHYLCCMDKEIKNKKSQVRGVQLGDPQRHSDSQSPTFFWTLKINWMIQ